LRYAFKNAAKHNATLVAASGDLGASGFEADGTTKYPVQVNTWPSSDPLVTSVGGTQQHLDETGTTRA
jgi:subtilase family serine protease